MSWHYSRVLVEAYSAANCSDGAPSAPLSGNPTPQAFLCSDRTKAFSRLSQFGMTFAPLTDDLGEAVLTSFLADFPAKTSPRLEKAQESKESGQECGSRWPESFAKWDQDSSSWKTPPCLLAEDSTEFSGTWPRWGMMRAGECSVQLMPGLRTSATGFGFWRSPTAREPGVSWERLETRTGETVGSMCRHYDKHTGRMAQIGLTQQVKARMWPTPTAHNAKEQDCPAEATRHTPTLCHQARGGDKTQPRHLNPTWVEWLMGWPLGWTGLRPLVTDKFQSWQHLHGKF